MLHKQMKQYISSELMREEQQTARSLQLETYQEKKEHIKKYELISN
ncbi:hypothetical protein [Oceanobacillus bengalensis]